MTKLATALLAVLFWNNHIGLFVSTLLYVVFYVWLYWRIVKFKAPRWMVKKDRRKCRDVAVVPASDSAGKSAVPKVHYGSGKRSGTKQSSTLVIATASQVNTDLLSFRAKREI